MFWMSRWQKVRCTKKTLGVANGKILLIGDAAGFFDPITGEGIGIAARQALLLEKYVEPVLKENSENLVKAMFDYSRASAQIYRRYQIMTSLVLLLRLWPKLTDGVIQVLHSFPALFQNCCLSICANTLKELVSEV